MNLEFLSNIVLMYSAFLLLKLAYKTLILEEIFIVKYRSMFLKISIIMLLTLSTLIFESMISDLISNSEESLISKIFTALFFSFTALAVPFSFLYFSKEQKYNYSIIGVKKSKLYPILKEHLNTDYGQIEFKDNSASYINNKGYEIGINYFKIKNIDEEKLQDLLKELEIDKRLTSIFYKIIGIVFLLISCLIAYESIIQLLKFTRELFK